MRKCTLCGKEVTPDDTVTIFSDEYAVCLRCRATQTETPRPISQHVRLKLIDLWLQELDDLISGKRHTPVHPPAFLCGGEEHDKPG